MIINGELIINNSINMAMEPAPNGSQQTSTTDIQLTVTPVGVIASIYLSDEYKDFGTWTFRTNTPGIYKFTASRFISFGVQNIRDEVKYTLDIQGVGVNQIIIQTQELVSAPSNDCNNVGVQITANMPIANINGEVVNPPQPLVVIEKNRNRSLQITVATDDPLNGTSSVVNSLTVSYMEFIQVFGLWQDVTVTESTRNDNIYEYNFGSGYQAFNKFHYTTAGVKIIRVKDQWGCIQTISHVTQLLPEVNPLDTPLEFYISKGNTFRFVERIDSKEECVDYRTDENTFDCETEYLDLTYVSNQMIKTCRDYKTQLKSSYSDHQAVLYNAETDIVEAVMIVGMVQRNLDVWSNLQYERYDDPDYSYIYFADGNIPYYYRVGGGLTVNGQLRAILGFVDNSELDVIAVRVILLTVSIGGTADYNYNKQPYNVFEFTMPASVVGAGLYYMTLIASRDADQLNYATDLFEVNVNFPNKPTVDLMWYCETNTDIWYGSGIQNFMTVGLDSRSPELSSETEIINGDYRNYLKNSFNVEKFVYVFEPLTLSMMQKLVYALNNQFLFFGGVGYVCESAEVNVLEPTTNLYVINATMVKTNENFKFVSGSGDIPFDWSSSVVTFDSSITFDSTVY